MQNRSNGDEFPQLLFIWTVFISHSFLKKQPCCAVSCLEVWVFVCFIFSILNISSDSLLGYKVSASLMGAGVGWLWGPWWCQMLTISFSHRSISLFALGAWAGERNYGILWICFLTCSIHLFLFLCFTQVLQFLTRNPCLFWRYFCAWIIVQIDVFEGVLATILLMSFWSSELYWC